MINKQSFIKMMSLAEQFMEEEDRWNKFGIEIYEMPISSITWDMFNCWSSSHFDPEGKDWISWYLWERKSINTNEVLACYDENGTPFYINTPEDLWNLVECHRLCIDSPCNFIGVGECIGL